jgi:hypothetical protein
MIKKILPFAILLFTISYTYGQSNSVEIWIRAFIPNPQNAGGGAGYIKQLPTGESAVTLHNFDQSLPNICFATDQRGFSDNAGTSSRLETKFTITLNSDGTGKVTPSQGRTTAGMTKKLDCQTGSVLDQKMGSVDNDIIGAPSTADGTVQVIGQIKGTNVLTPLGAAGPSINYDFDIQWKPSTSTLISTITISSFPAYEMYARQPGGKWTTILQQQPIGIPWTLGFIGGTPFGLHLSNISATKTVEGISGRWQTPLPEQRFSLEFSGKKVKWTEKNPSGTTLTKEVNISELPDGKFKIERPNTDEVLSFLGFQPSLRAEIIARNPQPSFIIFYWSGDKLIAEWNGLIATKDANAHLRELIQPGVRPPKIYELSKP